MESIQSLFKELHRDPIKTHISERGELLDYFLVKINSKVQKPYKPFTIKRLAMRLAHIPTKDLYYMKSQMEDIIGRKDTVSAIKWFFWSLKPESVMQ